ncbi:MAG: hypothetical protein JRJ73_16705 [Deltaproteobacteria bacterium]|nr:hypothetical protein [Deltaproteobacteria bacterium]
MKYNFYPVGRLVFGVFREDHIQIPSTAESQACKDHFMPENEAKRHFIYMVPASGSSYTHTY